MERRSTLPSGIGMALQLQDGNFGASSTADDDEERLSARSNLDKPMPELCKPTHYGLGNDRPAERTPAIYVNGTRVPSSHLASPTKASVFNDFCRGQPPRRSFLDSDGRTPPRFRMSRRSMLADKPELDTLLKAVMVQYKEEEYLLLNTKSVNHLAQYLNGSKPLAYTYCFKRLLINNETNKVRADLFVAALENVGMFCEHLVIVAPFHTIEFNNVFDRETGNPEPGSDWEKILECCPGLCTLTFEHPVRKPTNLTRDTLYSLNHALAHSTGLRYLDIQLDVPPEVMFDYHHDYHSRQRQSSSPPFFSTISTPLAMVSRGIIYADGAEGLGLLDADPVFGKADGIDEVVV